MYHSTRENRTQITGTQGHHTSRAACQWVTEDHSRFQNWIFDLGGSGSREWFLVMGCFFGGWKWIFSQSTKMASIIMLVFIILISIFSLLFMLFSDQRGTRRWFLFVMLQKIVLNHPRGTKHFSEISDKTWTHTHSTQLVWDFFQQCRGKKEPGQKKTKRTMLKHT